MKATYISAFLGAAILVSSCFGIDDENYPELAPLELTAVSDTINVMQGVELNYTGLSVESGLETKFEWA